MGIGVHQVARRLRRPERPPRPLREPGRSHHCGRHQRGAAGGVGELPSRRRRRLGLERFRSNVHLLRGFLLVTPPVIPSPGPPAPPDEGRVRVFLSSFKGITGRRGTVPAVFVPNQRKSALSRRASRHLARYSRHASSSVTPLRALALVGEHDAELRRLDPVERDDVGHPAGGDSRARRLDLRRPATASRSTPARVALRRLHAAAVVVDVQLDPADLLLARRSRPPASRSRSGEP